MIESMEVKNVFATHVDLKNLLICHHSKCIIIIGKSHLWTVVRHWRPSSPAFRAVEGKKHKYEGR